MSYRKRILEGINGALPAILKRFDYPISFDRFTISAEYLAHGDASGRGLFEVDFSDPPVRVSLAAYIWDYVFPILFQYRRQVFLKVLLIHEIYHYYQIGRIPEMLVMCQAPLPNIDIVNRLLIDTLQDNVVFGFTPAPFEEALHFYKNLEIILAFARDPKSIYQAIVDEEELDVPMSIPFAAPICLPLFCSDPTGDFRVQFFEGIKARLNGRQQQSLEKATSVLLDLFAETRETKTYAANLADVFVPYLDESYRIPSFICEFPLHVDFRGTHARSDEYLRALTQPEFK